MLSGTYTAIITPFSDDKLDYDGLMQLISFQIENKVDGILAVGTTGESPTLSWNEHNDVIHYVVKQAKGKCKCIAGTGSNNTNEALAASRHAVDAGVDAILLVDPYYNGPSSLEIRREYFAPIAEAFPKVQIIPYIIPGRTGAQLFPEDLAMLNRDFANVNTVKEATGDLENMKKTRKLCRADFVILSGDDKLTVEMMLEPRIKGGGVISVMANVAPFAISEMVRLIDQGKFNDAKKYEEALKPLFELVAYKTVENTPNGDVEFRARNPLPVKTLMQILGMPSGPCRRPIGKMTKAALKKLITAAKQVHASEMKIFKPVEDFFNVNVEERLNSTENYEGLYYEEY